MSFCAACGKGVSGTECGCPGSVAIIRVAELENAKTDLEARIRRLESCGGYCGHERMLGTALDTIEEFKPLVAAAREVAHEVDLMLSGGGDCGLEKCHECDLGPVGFLRDAMNKLRPLLSALPSTDSKSEGGK